MTFWIIKLTATFKSDCTGRTHFNQWLISFGFRIWNCYTFFGALEFLNFCSNNLRPDTIYRSTLQHSNPFFILKKDIFLNKKKWFVTLEFTYSARFPIEKNRCAHSSVQFSTYWKPRIIFRRRPYWPPRLRHKELIKANIHIYKRRFFFF